MFLQLVDQDLYLECNPVVVELEISNRTISQMRTDYLKYFDDDALLGVIGIKFFGTSE